MDAQLSMHDNKVPLALLALGTIIMGLLDRLVSVFVFVSFVACLDHFLV